MTLYKINPLRIEKIPLTIKNYPWPCGSKLRSKTAEELVDIFDLSSAEGGGGGGQPHFTSSQFRLFWLPE